MGDWTLFSNHGHVLVCLARDNEARLRDVAADVGITERAVQKIVRELQDVGFIAISKHGRCNHYRINTRKSLRHDLESHCTVGKLLGLVAKPATKSRRGAAAETSPVDDPPKPFAAESPASKATEPRVELSEPKTAGAAEQPEPKAVATPVVAAASAPQFVPATAPSEKKSASSAPASDPVLATPLRQTAESTDSPPTKTSEPAKQKPADPATVEKPKKSVKKDVPDPDQQGSLF